MPTTFQGVPCTLRSQHLCDVAEWVLMQIGHRCWRDHERVLGRIAIIRPMPRGLGTSTVGAWRLYPRPRLAKWGHGPVDEWWTWNGIGEVLIRESAAKTDDVVVSTFAHEFGHVVARQEDFEKRDGFDCEWAREAVADYYAYKWGFGRFIRKDGADRRLGHHGPLPGQIVEIGPERHPQARFVMTRRFYLIPVSAAGARESMKGTLGERRRKRGEREV